ncbi:MAG TPA: prefoldin subunit alpha [Methanocorpusculum sp.]|nr:prefoldin subunit alpha [Methanocorpusculum sp.]
MTANQTSLEQEAQALQAYMNEYSQQYEIMTQQMRFVETAKAEASASIETIQAISSAGGAVETLLALGGGVSVRAKIADVKNILVGIGADVTVEKSAEDTIEFLKNRITEMDASSKRLAESLGKLNEQISSIQKRMQEISQIYAAGQKQ